METLPETLQPWFAATIDIALAGCAGGATLLGRVPSNASFRFVRASLGLLVIGLLAHLWAGSMAMSGAPLEETFSAIRTVLLQTSFGATILVSAFGCVTLASALFLSGRQPPGRMRHGVAWAGLAILSYARAAAGHGMDSGWISMAVLVHALHVLAGSVWAGSVALCTCMAFTWAEWEPEQRIVMAHRVSHAATVALLVVIVSGILNTWRMLGSAALMLSEPYVRLLAWKLLLVLSAISMGAANRWLMMPRMRNASTAHQAASVCFGRILLVEWVVLVVVLILAARLGTTMPP